MERDACRMRNGNLFRFYKPYEPSRIRQRRCLGIRKYALLETIDEAIYDQDDHRIAYTNCMESRKDVS